MLHHYIPYNLLMTLIMPIGSGKFLGFVETKPGLLELYFLLLLFKALLYTEDLMYWCFKLVPLLGTLLISRKFILLVSYSR